MVRWMESKGYDIAYVTSVDLEQNPNLLLSHKVFMNTGHDEYYSDNMRAALTNAIAGGVDMAFFSANNFYYRITWAPSAIRHGEPAHPFRQERARGIDDVRMAPALAAAPGERDRRRHARGRRERPAVPRLRRQQLDLRRHRPPQLHRQRHDRRHHERSRTRTHCRASSATSSTRARQRRRTSRPGRPTSRARRTPSATRSCPQVTGTARTSGRIRSSGRRRAER